MIRIIAVILIFTICAQADRRTNSEREILHSECVLCEQDLVEKSDGKIAVMSRTSSPIRVYGNSDLKLCIPCACGDLSKDPEEECDDGNDLNGDGCNLACKEEYCGDKIVNLANEDCDDANSDNLDGCTSDCKFQICGDGILQGAEQCDAGRSNGKESSKCNIDCMIPVCGNQVIEIENDETCEGEDFLEAYQQKNLKVCNSKCQTDFCGDGTLSPIEECDDGNEDDTDYCSNDCKDQSTCDIFGIKYFEDGTKFAIDGDYQNLPCLVQKIEEWGGNVMQQRKTDVDQDLVNKFTSFVNLKATEHYCRSLGVVEATSEFDQCVAGYFHQMPWIYYHEELFLDLNCNFVRVNETAELRSCGSITYGVLGSPLALVYDQDKYKIANWNLVNFALNPSKGTKSVVWKGNSAAPLLVYDPDGTGVVKDGGQLFGNYFAYSQPVNKVSLEVKKYNDYIWDNGYQALASLDKNKDFKISGNELSNLYLWFDENSNAISEQGELKSVQAEGIKSIYTKYDTSDKEGNLHANLGFERESKGKIITGASVDWYTRAYNSADEAIKSINDLANKAAKKASNPIETLPTQIAAGKSAFRGIWIWQGDQSINGRVPAGVLAIDGASEKIEGASFVEEPIQVNGKPIKAKLIKVPLEGQALKNSGENYLRFNLKSEAGYTVSEAKLSKDGKSMLGKSFIEIVDRTRPNGKRLVSYQWSAKLSTLN